MIVAIADDLTGAAEIAAIGWRYGLRAEVHSQLDLPSTADLVVIDTDSRNCPAKEAVKRVRDAIKFLKIRPLDWIYKKIDSALRGNILAEAEAMQKAMAIPRSLIVPCNPSLGRTIHNGKYSVQGRLISESDFRNDPHHPITSSDVLEILHAKRSQVEVRKPTQPVRKAGVTVGEASSKADLQMWAAKIWSAAHCSARKDKTNSGRTIPDAPMNGVSSDILPMGGAEFFAALLEARGFKLKDRPSPPAVNASKRLFICGSASASAQLFISTARTKGLAVSSMPLRMANHLSDKKSLQEWKKKTQTALRFNSAVIAAIDLPLQAKSKSMEKYSEQLLAVAGSILDSESIGQIFIEGGATASSLVRQMGWSSLSVVHEWAPGVATMRVENDGGQFITIKPGSYQWPPEIVRLAATERIPFPVA